MESEAGLTEKIIYCERISSNRTEALFLALAALFLLLSAWRVTVGSLDALAGAFLFFFALFAFYSVNYRNLVIRLTPESLKLKFGIFTWNVPFDNIENSRIDELPAVMKYGGAGIHFMSIRKRYRASFNFLEYPRVVVTLKRKTGAVRDISFSTRRPDDVLRLIQNAVPAKLPTQSGYPSGRGSK
jgi:hypothetical protein